MEAVRTNGDGRMTLLYDPPTGWKVGFPKPYRPEPGETLADCLRRDGYPEEYDPEWAEKHTRFFNTVEGSASTESCH